MKSEDLMKLYSVTSVAQALDCSRGQVYNLMKSGDLKFVQLGCHKRIPGTEVQRIATEGTK